MKLEYFAVKMSADTPCCYPNGFNGSSESIMLSNALSKGKRDSPITQRLKKKEKKKKRLLMAGSGILISALIVSTLDILSVPAQVECLQSVKCDFLTEASTADGSLQWHAGMPSV